MTAPLCPYCGAAAQLVTGAKLYPHRPDLAHVKAWQCYPCRASVGCHDGTITPKGTLANGETKRARMRAHAAFDPVWKNWQAAYPGQRGTPNIRQAARGRAYRWLAEQLGIDFRRCHIGEFDVQACERVVAIIQEQRPTAVTVRAWWKARQEQAA